MLVDLETGGLRSAGPGAPALSSAAGPWTGVLLEHHVVGGPLDLRDVAPKDHHLIVQLRRNAMVEWHANGQTRTVEVQPGQVVFQPAMVPFGLRTEDIGEYAVLSLDPRFVRSAAYDMFSGIDAIDWRPALGFDDALVRSVVLTLKEEVTTGFAGGRTYGDSLATAVAAHLVRRHSSARPVRPARDAGLSQTHYRRVVDYIQSHLSQEIPISSLAEQAGLSPFHFARLFKQTTGQSPHQYVILRRVERARQLLLVTARATADVALEVGFCDQSHLTTHFRRIYGVTPREFRRGGRPSKNVLESAVS